MSPAVAKRKADEMTSTIPAVAEAIGRRREADIDLLNRRLADYCEAVTLAAEGKQIPATVADAAVVAAHELRLRHDRLEGDVAALALSRVLEKQMAEFKAGSSARRDRMAEIKLQLIAAEQLLRDLRAEHHRLSVAGSAWVAWNTQRSELERDNPHLFNTAAAMSDADWQRVRT